MQIIDSFGISSSCTNTVNCLPELQGAGLVRDMREAMSLTDAQGNLITIASSLQTQEHQGMRDRLIGVWDNKPIDTMNFAALRAASMPRKRLKGLRNCSEKILKHGGFRKLIVFQKKAKFICKSLVQSEPSLSV